MKCGFFADLLSGPGNVYWDLGRITSALATLALLGAAGWNVYIGEAIELGPTGFGGGMAAILTASAALIFAKDKAATAAAAQVADAANDTVAPSGVRK